MEKARRCLRESGDVINAFFSLNLRQNSDLALRGSSDGQRMMQGRLPQINPIGGDKRQTDRQVPCTVKVSMDAPEMNSEPAMASHLSPSVLGQFVDNLMLQGTRAGPWHSSGAVGIAAFLWNLRVFSPTNNTNHSELDSTYYVQPDFHLTSKKDTCLLSLITQRLLAGDGTC